MLSQMHMACQLLENGSARKKFWSGTQVVLPLLMGEFGKVRQTIDRPQGWYFMGAVAGST